MLVTLFNQLVFTEESEDAAEALAQVSRPPMSAISKLPKEANRKPGPPFDRLINIRDACYSLSLGHTLLVFYENPNPRAIGLLIVAAGLCPSL